ncbi:CRTAC1 family protein [Leptolyngbya sp. 7M]|uniref:CRTAC1 family protein n=1 Tax=Leptolyngbya sp. 7M TaxID=2812896 RepID=UPI001B8BB713|nr:CRTAC1 family protein [Leptolyngbya sp. 7M]QYO67075.1 CRTAC1 family protein [Leptolyngbya sp. 7M]
MKRFLIHAALLGSLAIFGCQDEGSGNNPGTDETVSTFIRFNDVTRTSGITFRHEPTRTEEKLLPEIMGSGLLVADLNRDGAPDVLLVNSGALSSEVRNAAHGNRLYINDGKGNFTDKTDEWQLPSRGYGMGAAVGDFDNDGFPDVLLTHFDGNDLLLRNTGERFEDVTAKAGITPDGKWSTSAGFIDIDNDGDLDIYVVRYVEFSPISSPRSFRNRILIYPTPLLFDAVPDRVWRNDGNGRFTDITEPVGIKDSPQKGLALAIGDIDLDGHSDVYIANDTTPNQLWMNTDGRFKDVAQLAGAAYDEMGREEGSMGADFSDLDGNGLPDIVVTNFQTEVTSLYLQTGKGLFAERSDVSGMGRTSRERLSFGIDAFDANNNGLEDILFVNGHIEDNIHLNSDTVTFAQQNSLFENLGGGKFRDISGAAGDALSDVQVSRGLATGDLNGDGLIDYVVNNNGGTAQVAFNATEKAGGFVVFWLEGKKANRSAIGARVVAKMGERSIERQVMGAQSYLSVGDLRLHFGLADAERIDELTIYWPGSEKQVITNISRNGFYYIREGAEPVGFIPGEKRIEP